MKKKYVLFLSVMLILALIPEPGMAVMQKITGTKIRLSPPEGFTKATQFPGFMLEEIGASIMVTEIPGPYNEVTEDFNKPETYEKQGMTLIDIQVVNLDERETLLVHASQQAYGIDFLKWIVALGDDSETVLIAATFPKEVEKEFSQPLKDAVLSSVWDKNAEIDFWEGLTFRVMEAGNFQLAQSMSNNVVLTIGGEFPSKSPNDPFVIVGSSMFEDLSISQKNSFAERRLKQTDYLKDIQVIVENTLEIDQLSGISHLAKAIDSETGEERFVYQVMLFDSQGYYLMQGFCQFNERSIHEPIFNQIFSSFHRTLE